MKWRNCSAKGNRTTLWIHTYIFSVSQISLNIFPFKLISSFLSILYNTFSPQWSLFFTNSTVFFKLAFADNYTTHYILSISPCSEKTKLPFNLSFLLSLPSVQSFMKKKIIMPENAKNSLIIFIVSMQELHWQEYISCISQFWCLGYNSEQAKSLMPFVFWVSKPQPSPIYTNKEIKIQRDYMNFAHDCPLHQREDY